MLHALHTLLALRGYNGPVPVPAWIMQFIVFKIALQGGRLLASNQARAYFALCGYHFNPGDITRLLDIQPTSINAAGASSGLDKPVISSWELSTETVTDEVDVYKLTDNLLKQIEPAKEKILQVIKSHNLSPRLGVELVLSI